MATTRPGFGTKRSVAEVYGRAAESHASLDADIIIANAPDPVFVSDLEGKILQANDAVSQLLGFRQDEVLEQSLSRSEEHTSELQSQSNLVCRLLLEKKKNNFIIILVRSANILIVLPPICDVNVH